MHSLISESTYSTTPCFGKAIILIMAITILGVNTGWGQSKDTPPNIIYILADDLGYGDVNLRMNSLDVFNNPHIRTPELARLAQQSKVFTHHYAAHSICSPSRAGLLTGRVPTRMDIMTYIGPLGGSDAFLGGSEVTIAEVLKEKGYQTAVFGKWHLNGRQADWTDRASWTGWTGSFPTQQGFDYAMVTQGNPHETQTGHVGTQRDPGSYYLDTGEEHGKPLGVIKGYDSQIIADSAMAWIRHKRDSEKPYFLYLPFGAPHEEVESPVAFNNLYDTGNAFKNRYYANVTHLDSQIGKILDKLLALEQRENTIVIFSSDNGPAPRQQYGRTTRSYGTPAPLFGGKGQLFEGGIRVPGMIRWPDKISPGVSEFPNSTVDVLPTILDIVGADPPENRPLDGTSLLPHLTDSEDVQRDKPLFWHVEEDRNEPVEGVGYNRGYYRPTSGAYNIPDVLTPVAVTRRGDYVLRAFRDPDEEFAPPNIFELYNVAKYREERVELSKFEPERFEQMKGELLEMWEEVNEDRKQARSDIENQVDQRE